MERWKSCGYVRLIKDRNTPEWHPANPTSSISVGASLSFEYLASSANSFIQLRTQCPSDCTAGSQLWQTSALCQTFPLKLDQYSSRESVWWKVWIVVLELLKGMPGHPKPMDLTASLNCFKSGKTKHSTKPHTKFQQIQCWHWDRNFAWIHWPASNCLHLYAWNIYMQILSQKEYLTHKNEIQET